MGLADYIKSQLPYWPNWITYPLMKINIFGGLCYGRAYMSFEKELKKKSSNDRLLEIVNYAIKNVPYYRKRYGSIQIHTISEFEEKIGYIDKNEVMAHWNEFIADGADLTKCNQGTTGGTSGKPLKLMTPKNRYVQSMYFWHRQLKRFGWNYDVVALIRNHKLPEKKSFLINPVMRQIIFDGFRNNDDYYRVIWKTLKRFNVHYLHCYPSAAYAFLKFCHRQNLDTSMIKACFLTSEAITDNQLYFIKNVLGISVLGSYGHSEKLCQAGTCPDKFLYHIDEEYGYTELLGSDGCVIKEKEKLGEIVGTTFYNKYFPLIRYRTGDYSSYSKSLCEKHNDMRFLNPIQGRWDKAQIIRIDGTMTSITALNLHSDIYERISGLQYVQDRKGYITVLIIKDEDYKPSDHKYMVDYLSSVMGGAEYVEIRYVSELIYQSNGKFLPLISKLDQNA